MADGWSISRLEDLLWRCLSARCELLPPFDDATRESLDALLAQLDTVALRTETAMVELQRWGLHANTARSIAKRLPVLADAVDAVREAGTGLPGFVVACKEGPRLPARRQVPAWTARPKPARACVLGPPGSHAVDAVPHRRHSADDARPCPRRALHPQAPGRPVRLRRHALARRRGPRGPTRRGASGVDAQPVALRPHRRVPGHRRDAVVDLPPRLLRAGPLEEHRLSRRRPEAIHLSLPRRGRGHVSTRARRDRAGRTPHPSHPQLPRDVGPRGRDQCPARPART